MKHNSQVAIWAGVINANIWAASGSQPLDFLLAAVWLAFSATVIYLEVKHDPR